MGATRKIGPSRSVTTMGSAGGGRLSGLHHVTDVIRYSSRAIALVWSTHRGLTIALAALTLVAGLLPAAVAWIGKMIVDTVVALVADNQAGVPVDHTPLLWLVAAEGVLVAGLAGAHRGIQFVQSLLRLLLGPSPIGNGPWP